MDLLKKGKYQIVIMISVLILFDMASIIIVTYVKVTNGTNIDMVKLFLQSTVRLILSATMYYFLYKGHNWARITSIVLIVLSLFVGFISLIISLNVLTAVGVIVMVKALYTLTLSKSALMFLKRHRLEVTPPTSLT